MKIKAAIWGWTLLLLISFSSNQNNNFDESDESNKIDLVLDSIQVTVGGKAMNEWNLNLSNRYRVVTVINGESQKSIEMLEKLEKLMITVGIHHHYAYLVYVYGDKKGLTDYSSRDGALTYKYPLLYDSLNAFREANYGVVGGGYNTFLLDENNEIIESDKGLSEDFFKKVITHSKKQPKFLDSPPQNINPLESNP